jgi:hypothetical protein
VKLSVVFSRNMRRGLVPSRVMESRWMNSSKAANQLMMMHKSLRGKMRRRSSNLSPLMH